MLQKMSGTKQPASSGLETPSSPGEAAETPEVEPRDDERLDEALEQTFPASDPISLPPSTKL